MKEIQISQRSLWLSLLTAVAGLYALAGVVLNPFIIWVSLPLYIGYTMVLSGIKKSPEKKAIPRYGLYCRQPCSDLLLSSGLVLRLE
jgi:hypothetical protein